MAGTTTQLWDRDYDGPRWRYGLTYRPLGYATVPDGWIIKSDREHPGYRHGTIDYPRRLSADEVKAYELVEVVA